MSPLDMVDFSDGVHPIEDHMEPTYSNRDLNPNTISSIWFQKKQFPDKHSVRLWLSSHGDWNTRIEETINFFVAPQNELLKKKYKSKIRSKYIRNGVLIRFVPARYVSNLRTNNRRYNIEDVSIRSPRPEQIKHVCMDCKKTIKKNIEEPHVVSHGICKDCYRKRYNEEPEW